jgi:flavin-dependent dehydrogenase
VSAANLVEDGVPFAYAPRRKVLDKLLVDAAVEAGAEFRDRFSVDDFLAEDGRVTGIKGRQNPGGGAVTEQARIVVGADGRNSRLARFVEAPIYDALPVLTCYYFSYWSGVPSTAQELYRRDGYVIFTMPTNDGLNGIFASWRIDRLSELRTDIEGSFMQALANLPELEERVRAGRREERFYGASDLPNFFRRPYGLGWALVGDAGGGPCRRGHCAASAAWVLAACRVASPRLVGTVHFHPPP